MTVRIQLRSYDLEKLNTPGGHIAVCLVLIFTGMGAAYSSVPHGSELVVFALGVLSRSMMDREKAK